MSTYCSAVLRKCFKRGKAEVPKNKRGEAGIQLFSVPYAILIDIRLDQFPRVGGEKKARGVNAPPKVPCAVWQ